MQEELKDLSSFLNAQDEEPKREIEPDEEICDILDNRKSLQIRFVVLAVMFVFSFYLSMTNINGNFIIPAIIDPWVNTTSYLCTLAFLLVVSMAISFNVIRIGFIDLFTGTVTYDTPGSICSIVCLMHIVYYIITGNLGEYEATIYSSVAILVLLCNCGGKLVMLKRALTNAEIAECGQCQTEKILSEDRLVNELMDDQGFDFPVASVKCETGKLTKLDDITFSPDFSEDISKYSFPIMVVFGALLAAGLTLITGKNIRFSIDYFVAMVCVSSALTEAFVSNIPFWKVDKHLAEEGSFIGGYETLEAFEDINAIVIEDKEFYPQGSLKLHGMKTFCEKSANEIIIDAASLMSEADGVMKDVLISTISGDVSELHSVSSIKVSNAGTSGKIGGETIFMGSRDYMIENGIGLSEEAMEFESGYQHSGKSIIYMAENNELVAVFVISYRPSRKMAKEMFELSKTDYTIILYSSDPNINPAKIAADYQFEERFIKQVSDEQRTEMIGRIAPVEKAPAYICIGENSKSRLRIFNTINALRKNIKLGVIMQTAFMIVEYLIYVAMVFFMPENAISFTHILLFKAVFSVITLIPGMTFKI